MAIIGFFLLNRETGFKNSPYLHRNEDIKSDRNTNTTNTSKKKDAPF